MNTLLSTATLKGRSSSESAFKLFYYSHCSYVPSQADTAVFEALSGAPKSDTPHALRWYNHIKSFAAGMKQFPKASKDAKSYTSGAAASSAAADDDDDVDLFGSDEEDDAEKQRITEERLKAYHEKKSKKPKVIAKTSVLFDVKPWDDETDMEAMKTSCKSIEMDGLVWGATKVMLASDWLIQTNAVF